METTETTTDEQNVVIKKHRKFHGKEFRENLKSNNGLAAIKEFVFLCTEEKTKQDYALEFIESGGNLLEFIQLLDSLEKKSAAEIVPVFEAFNIILLKILSKRPDKLLNSEETCREFLVKFYPLTKSMLNLNSTSKQRNVALKLLSTMTTTSATLAQDVLGYASFDRPVLELLTSSDTNKENSSVRTSFIHFLLSFLVDGNISTINSFLEKKGLLTSIFPGLIYDKCDTVELVLLTVQSKVIEERRVTKSLKMDTFNTHVIRNLINLYNWKGPVKKKTGNLKKRIITKQIVNPVEKQKVCECVHQFLLVLCTSKYGIVFRDTSLGLGNKFHNPLILTVLQGLERPWDHDLASELVSKICITCPDLVKPVLTEVVPFLEPRVSKKWLKTIQFVQNLIKNLTSEYISQYFENMNIKQVAVVIQSFCVPKNILQIVSDQNLLHEYLGIRQEIAKLLYVMCKMVSEYLKHVNNMSNFTSSDKTKLRDLILNYLEQNLPSLSIIVQVWNKGIETNENIEKAELPLPRLSSHLSTLLDILHEYNYICPPALDEIPKEINILNFLQTIENICNDDDNLRNDMNIKAINLFLSCDFSSFLPSTEIFAYSLSLLLDIFTKGNTSQGEHRKNIENTLFCLLKTTGVFEGCTNEINIWLYAFLECNSYDKSVGQFFTSVLKDTYLNFLNYCNEIVNIRCSLPGDSTFSYKALIESLSLDIFSFQHEKITQTILSPLIIGLLTTYANNDFSSVSSFVNIALTHLLHAQTSPQLLTAIILQEKYGDILNKKVLKYFQKWNDCNGLISLKKVYESKNVITKLSQFLIGEKELNIDYFTNFFTDGHEDYHVTLSVQLTVFYLTQLTKNNCLSDDIHNKCFDIASILLQKSQSNSCIDIILKHPILIQSFAPTQSDNSTQNLSTKFVLKIIENLLKTVPKSEIEPYLNSYRVVLLRQLCLMLGKIKKHGRAPKSNNFMAVVDLLDLSFEQCNELLKICSNLPSECLVTSENTISSITELLSYILKRNVIINTTETTLKPFDNDVMKYIGKQLLFLNSYKVEIKFDDFETSVYTYIHLFPQTLEQFDEEIFKSILLKPNISRNTCRLAMQFLKCNVKYFEATQSILSDIIDKRELVFSLLYIILHKPKDEVDDFIKNIYSKHESTVQKVLNKPQKVAQYIVDYYETIIKLITDYMDINTCKEFASKSHKFDVSETYHFEIITAIYDRCVKSLEDKNKYVSNYITTVMSYILNILKRPEHTEEDKTKIGTILKAFCVYLKKIVSIYKINYIDEDLSKNSTFQTFSKLALKYGLQGIPCLIEALKHLSEFCGSENEEYLGTLFEMAISHSESLNIILDDDNKAKPPFVELLYILCKKCPSVMAKNHIPVWLGAYGGTLSVEDQCLLKLMNLYEAADIGFHEYKPYLWGKAAARHYSLKFGVETALWRQPKPKEVIDLFAFEKIKDTIRYFPRKRFLNPDQPLYSDDERSVYDPAFYLPLLGQLLAPESTIRWYHCKFGAISLAIIALTSDDSNVRTAACHVLARFHNHLDSTRQGKDRLLWLHFIEAICRATSLVEDLRMSSIAGIFFSRCALIFNQSYHTLYSALTKYIMAKQCPDISRVPEMLELLHSTDAKFVEHRNFTLQVMRDGLRSDNDLKVMFTSVAFKLIMDMFTSVVINHEGRKLILEILTAAVTIPSGARILTGDYGLLSWLIIVIRNFNQQDGDLIATTVNLIHKLYLSLDSAYFKYTFNIILCLISLIDCFKVVKFDIKDLCKFVNVLYFVYNANPKMLTRSNLDDLLDISSKFVDCRICKYYLQCGVDFVERPQIQNADESEESLYYLKLLTVKWIETNKQTKLNTYDCKY